MNAPPEMNGRYRRPHPRSYTRAVEVLLALAVAVAGVAAGVVIGLRRRPGPDEGPDRDASDLETRLLSSETDRGRMAAVLTAMPDGVILFEGTGATAYHNAAVEPMIGAVPATLDGLLPLPFRRIAAHVASDRERRATDAEVGAPTRWLRGVAVPVGDEGVLLTIRDVTAAKRLDQIRRDFVANASHELKTPAATIQAAAETIRTAAVDDPQVIPRFASQLEREAIRLSAIVSDLLDLSRLEAGSDRDDAVALDAVVRDEAERFAEQAAESNLALRFETPPVARLRGSARDLALMVRNLVDNAIRYTPPGGEVVVALRDGPDAVTLSVADTGIGIPKRDVPRIFERFYRIDRARSRETGGTGLGLAIVRHVVENHGGDIAVETELGAGTRFDIRLPIEPASP